jgi:hypothetical protein
LQFCADHVHASDIDGQARQAEQERHRDGGDDEDKALLGPACWGFGVSGSTDCHDLIIGGNGDFP